jgi:hypothetical protein
MFGCFSQQGREILLTNAKTERRDLQAETRKIHAQLIFQLLAYIARKGERTIKISARFKRLR